MIEKLVYHFKKFTIIPCFFGLVGFLVMIILGSFTLLKSVYMLPEIWRSHFDYQIAKSAIVVAIFAIDQYLIAFVFFIFSAGIYGLFLSEMQPNLLKNTSALKIKNLDQLKNALGKTVILALLIEYFKFAIEMDYVTSLDLLYLSCSILAVSLAMFFLFGQKSVKK